MLKINKDAEPAFFAEFKLRHQPKSWNDLKSVATRLRQHIMRYEQTTTKTALCTYCEQRVTVERAHIDHIRPKDPGGGYAHLFADYNNLTVSCCSNESCGHKKGNEYQDDLINPVEENPSDYMTYEVSTGKIIPVNDAVHARVENTCRMLGLNSCYELVRARGSLLRSLDGYRKGGVIAYYIDNFEEFPTLIDFYRREFLQRGI